MPKPLYELTAHDDGLWLHLNPPSGLQAAFHIPLTSEWTIVGRAYVETLQTLHAQGKDKPSED